MQFLLLKMRTLCSSSKNEIVDKLDKVADSLESTTSQLSGVVTQQQLDLIRERLVKAESDLSTFKEVAEISLAKSREDQKRQIDEIESVKSQLSEIERDVTASRALTFSSFALGTISIVGLVLCAIYL